MREVLHSLLLHRQERDLEDWYQQSVLYALTTPNIPRDKRRDPPAVPATIKELMNGHA